MKTIYHYILNHKKLAFMLPLLALLFTVSACRDELDPATFENSELSITTSSIDEFLPSLYSTKYAFNWTAANNMGTNSAISYTLEYDKKGDNFANPQKIEAGKNIYSHEIAIGELNSILVDTYGAVPGTPITMEARITATFADASVATQTAVTEFTVTPFKPFATHLYIIGSAASGDFDPTKGIAMTQSETNPAEYTYSGSLIGGAFVLADSNSDTWTQNFYTRSADSDSEMVYTEGAVGDLYWQVSAGMYKITANVTDLTIKIEPMAAPDFSDIYIVGDASVSGWDVDAPKGHFTQDSDNPFLFTMETDLTAGSFKLLVGSTGDWCGKWYRPKTDGEGIADGEMNLQTGCDPDNKWAVTSATAGRYLITIDASKNTIKFEKVQVYMIGDATPNGWNMGSLTPMTYADGKYTWTGALTAGSFKFTKFNTDWCQGTELVAVTADQDISNTAFAERVKCAGGDATDLKWKVTGAQAGTYTFVLDLSSGKLSITKK